MRESKNITLTRCETFALGDGDVFRCIAKRNNKKVVLVIPLPYRLEEKYNTIRKLKELLED